MTIPTARCFFYADGENAMPFVYNLVSNIDAVLQAAEEKKAKGRA